jgi:peptidoglycan/xylan/chitin deacetylase (PgdA/CDA1 family)
MLRAIGKTCFAYAYTLTNARRFYPRPRSGTTPFIVCYHRVVENFERSAAGTIPSMLISKRMLERQIDWMARRFSLLSLDEIGSHLESGRPFETPVAAITFDDGYSDVYHHAYPLLRSRGIPAAFFVVTGLVDSRRPQIFDQLYLLLRLLQGQGIPLGVAVRRALEAAGAGAAALAKFNAASDDPFPIMTAVLNGFRQQDVEAAITVLEEQVSPSRHALQEMMPLTWDMIRTMQKGGMTIGSHTHSHLLLPAESIQTAQRELVQSKQILDARLNTSIKHFAYPDGRFNAAVVNAVDRAGYRFAYSICNSRDEKAPLLTIRRKVLWERACVNAFGKFSPAVMNCQANWAFDVGRCDHDHSCDQSVPCAEAGVPQQT